MAVRAGQRTTKSGDIKCQECEGTTHVEKGQQLKACECGCKDFEEIACQCADVESKRSSRQDTSM